MRAAVVGGTVSAIAMARQLLSEDLDRRSRGATCRACRADGPAGAVLALQRAAGNRATRAVLARNGTGTARRSPQATSTTRLNDHELRVRLDDGSTYRVKRRVRAREVIDPGDPAISFHRDRERVWMRVAWCQGTKGQIDIGANPQGAAEQLLQRIGREISQGGGTDQVIEAVEQTELEPFLEVDVRRSQEWRVTGDVRVRLNRSGVPGFDAGLTLDFGSFRLRGSVSGSDLQGPARDRDITGTVNVEIPLGPQPDEPCPPKMVEVLWEYECHREREETVPVTLRTPDLRVQDDDKVYIYFPHASDAPDLARSAGELARLDQLVADGYRIHGVDGYASPEGPQGPHPAGRFGGNQALSQARAQAALDLVRERCGSSDGGVSLRMRTCVEAEAAATGHGEMYPEEVEGRDLWDHVVDEFTGDSGEIGRLPLAEQRRIRGAAGNRRKAELIYPWLRRAVIRLQRTRVQRGGPVTVQLRDTRLEPVSCPAAVEQAAEEVWGKRRQRQRVPAGRP